jgi:hypothetical protein
MSKKCENALRRDDVPLYEITESGLRQHAAAGFATLGLYERADLQRLLREDISAVGDDLLVIAEEFASGRTHDGGSTCLRSTRPGI